MEKLLKLFGIVIVFCFGLISNFKAEQTPVDNTQEEGKPETNSTSDKDFETWVAPKEIITNYPYYKAGYDPEGRPIWITEFGKWNLKRIVDSGEKAIQIFDKYCDQWVYRVQKSIKDKSTPQSPVNGWVFIFDMDDYPLSQVSSIKTVAYTLKKASVVEKACRTMDYGFLINMNYIAETLINAARPFLGNTLDRIEVTGTTKAKWLPGILRKIPRSQLPEKYGGYKNFTPIAVYG